MQQDPPQAPQMPQSLPPVQPGQGSGFYRPATSPQYHETQATQPVSAAPANNEQDFSWEASEYVHNTKGILWVVGFLLIFAAVAVVAVWIKAWIFLTLVVLMAVAIGIFAFRQPHVLRYSLDNLGVHINEKFYNYTEFSAFGIIQEGAFFTMTFIPVKRFSPALSIYFSGTDGEKIVDLAGKHLPMEKLKLDFIDKTMRKLHF